MGHSSTHKKQGDSAAPARRSPKQYLVLLLALVVGLCAMIGSIQLMREAIAYAQCSQNTQAVVASSNTHRPEGSSSSIRLSL